MAEVRRAGVDDLDVVVMLEQECEGQDAWSPALLSEGLAGTVPTVRYLVAEQDASVLGYAVLSCVDDVAELQRIGVSGRARRSGVGRQLLEAALGEGRRNGMQRMLLEVRADNHAALGLYAAYGFVEIDRRPRYYRDGATAIVMRLRIAKGCGW